MARTYVKSGSNLIDIANYIGDLYENSRYYTSREYDRETKLYYYRARYYSTELGRFISRDPIDTSDDVNLYNYVGGNPVNFNDPTGQMKDYLSISVNFAKGGVDGVLETVVQVVGVLEVSKNGYYGLIKFVKE